MNSENEKMIVIRSLLDSLINDLNEGDASQAKEKAEIARSLAYETEVQKEK